MNVQEIFNRPEVEAVEIEILNVMAEVQPYSDDSSKIAVQHLLSVRKRILNKLFELNDESKQLLSDFNDSLINAQLVMRKRLLTLIQSTHDKGLDEIEYWGKVFMGYKHSELHPMQTMRAKKIWALLNGSYDNYLLTYEDGVNAVRLTKSEKFPSENQLLYLSDETDNWNEGLNREKSSDMKLCYAFHNLYDHNDFSIFDLLWVRDFAIEVGCESTCNIGNSDCDDIDWRKCDYYD